MKVKTSITLSRELLAVVDRYAKQQERNRSELIEVSVKTFLQNLARQEQDARDLEILNRRAKELNDEAKDVLAYQIPL